jgi:hypothetical protein
MIKENGRNNLNARLENLSKAWPNIKTIFSAPHSLCFYLVCTSDIHLGSPLNSYRRGLLFTG